MILVGHIEIKTSDKTGKVIFSIPFRGKFDYFISENKTKKGETSPDWLIWMNGIRIGFLWKNKYLKDAEEKNYLSGNIFAPGFGLDKDKMKIVIFENSIKNGIWEGYVYWSFDDDKKPIDQKTEPEENLEDGIF